MTTSAAREKTDSFVEAMLGRILIRPDDFKYGGAIIIPEKHQRRPTVGTVVSLNLDPQGGNPNNFQIGDRVVYGVYSGTPILLTIDGVDTPLIALTPEEIIVRLKGKTDLKEAGQGY